VAPRSLTSAEVVGGDDVEAWRGRQFGTRGAAATGREDSRLFCRLGRTHAVHRMQQRVGCAVPAVEVELRNPTGGSLLAAARAVARHARCRLCEQHVAAQRKPLNALAAVTHVGKHQAHAPLAVGPRVQDGERGVVGWVVVIDEHRGGKSVSSRRVEQRVEVRDRHVGEGVGNASRAARYDERRPSASRATAMPDVRTVGDDGCGRRRAIRCDEEAVVRACAKRERRRSPAHGTGNALGLPFAAMARRSPIAGTFARACYTNEMHTAGGALRAPFTWCDPSESMLLCWIRRTAVRLASRDPSARY
jgi:hypothetical protein